MILSSFFTGYYLGRSSAYSGGGTISNEMFIGFLVIMGLLLLIPIGMVINMSIGKWQYMEGVVIDTNNDKQVHFVKSGDNVYRIYLELNEYFKYKVGDSINFKAKMPYIGKEPNDYKFINKI